MGLNNIFHKDFFELLHVCVVIYSLENNTQLEESSMETAILSETSETTYVLQSKHYKIHYLIKYILQISCIH